MTNNMAFYLYNRLGDNMKKILIVSVLLGIFFSLIIYLNYRKNSIIINNQTTLYFLQISAYKDMEYAKKLVNNLENYIIIEESDHLYHVYVGITYNLKNSEKIKEFYEKNNYNIYVRQKVVSCENFISDLKKYDTLLTEANNKEVSLKIEKEVLNKYKEYNCENIRNG